MPDILQLKKCSYKGIEFAFVETTTTGGNRLIKYNYPGSDVQAIERQGKAPRSFTIPAILPYDGYFAKKEQLINILDDGEKGVLVHPFWGDIENIVVGAWTLDEKITNLGRAVLTIQFELDDAVGVPIDAGDLQTLTGTQFSLLNEILSSDVSDIFNVSLGFIGNFTDANITLNDMADAFVAVSERAKQIPAQSGPFFKVVDSFRNSTIENIQKPDKLATDITTVFEAMDDLYETPEERYFVCQGLYNFGEGDIRIRETTAGRIERKRNRDLLNSTIKTLALSYSYYYSVQITYETTEDIDRVQSDLETQYSRIRQDRLVSNAVLEQMDRTRVQAIKTLDNVRVTTRQIFTISGVLLQPLSVLIYAWYGDLKLVDTIADLNNIKQNAFVAGEIKLVIDD